MSTPRRIAYGLIICGAVRIRPQARVLFGTVLTAEDSEISIGARSVVVRTP
jgi:carbonic anhydrase/acetyltransferase-like protein (isoleucine patch superfamily)